MPTDRITRHGSALMGKSNRLLATMSCVIPRGKTDYAPARGARLGSRPVAVPGAAAPAIREQAHRFRMNSITPIFDTVFFSRSKAAHKSVKRTPPYFIIIG